VKINLDRIERAENLISKLLGLMGRRDFGKSAGLLLRNTNSIHTFFVFFPIDLVFLDKNFKVIKTVENLRPFWFSPIIWKASNVLELPVGTVKSKNINVDDQINLL